MRDKLGQFLTSDKNVCKFDTATNVATEGKLSKKMKKIKIKCDSAR